MFKEVRLSPSPCESVHACATAASSYPGCWSVTYGTSTMTIVCLAGNALNFSSEIHKLPYAGYISELPLVSGYRLYANSTQQKNFTVSV